MLPVDEDRRAEELHERERGEDEWRPAQGGERDEATDATDEDHRPDDPEQRGLPLDAWDQPAGGETDAQPLTREKAKVAVEERRDAVADDVIQRAAYAVEEQHASGRHGDRGHDPGGDLQTPPSHLSPWRMRAR